MSELLESINEFIEIHNHFSDYEGNISKVIELITRQIINKNIIKNKKNIFVISRLISRYVGFEDIEFNEDHLKILLDFIDWDISYIMEHSDDWTISFEDCGSDVSKILQFADKYNKKINGLSDSSVMFSICVAIIYCNDEFVSNYVINNNIQISKDIFDERDSLLYDMEEWSEIKKYTLFI